MIPFCSWTGQTPISQSSDSLLLLHLLTGPCCSWRVPQESGAHHNSPLPVPACPWHSSPPSDAEGSKPCPCFKSRQAFSLAQRDTTLRSQFLWNFTFLWQKQNVSSQGSTNYSPCSGIISVLTITAPWAVSAVHSTMVLVFHPIFGRGYFPAKGASTLHLFELCFSSADPRLHSSRDFSQHWLEMWSTPHTKGLFSCTVCDFIAAEAT